MAQGKRLAAAYAGASSAAKSYPLAEAVALIKANAKAKFDETVEIAMNLGIDPRHADQMVRGLVSLPNGTGKTLRIGVFARGPKAEEAQAAGADVVGAEDLAEKVQAGEIDFDRCIATPDMMALVGRLGKILGPRGLMPNPRLGTVTMDVKGAIQAAKAGQVEFRAEKAGIVHAGIGKASFPADKLVENARAFADAIVKAKPAGAKGTYRAEGGAELHHGAGRAGGRGQPRRLRRAIRRPVRGAGGQGAGAPEPVRDRTSSLGRVKGLRPARGRRGSRGRAPGGSGCGRLASDWTGEPGRADAPERTRRRPRGQPGRRRSMTHAGH